MINRIGWGNILVLTPYNRRFRNIRKHLHRLMGAQSVKRFWPVQEQHAKDFLRRIYLEGQDPHSATYVTDSIHWMTGSLILLIACSSFLCLVVERTLTII
jgi:hypothetical protein